MLKNIFQKYINLDFQLYKNMRNNVKKKLKKLAF